MRKFCRLDWNTSMVGKSNPCDSNSPRNRATCPSHRLSPVQRTRVAVCSVHGSRATPRASPTANPELTWSRILPPSCLHTASNLPRPRSTTTKGSCPGMMASLVGARAWLAASVHWHVNVVDLAVSIARTLSSSSCSYCSGNTSMRSLGVTKSASGAASGAAALTTSPRALPALATRRAGGPFLGRCVPVAVVSATAWCRVHVRCPTTARMPGRALPSTRAR
jgi:hypothetical protein